MTDPVESAPDKRRGRPTEKMIAAARGAADRQGVKLPENVDSDFDACKAFLDEFLTRPSPKAIAFAERLAKQNALELPESVRTNAKELSAWIDEHNKR